MTPLGLGDNAELSLSFTDYGLAENVPQCALKFGILKRIAGFQKTGRFHAGARKKEFIRHLPTEHDAKPKTGQRKQGWTSQNAP